MSLTTEWEPSKTNICEVCSSEVEAQSFIQATRNTSSKPRSTDFPGTVHFPVESLHKVLFNSKELAKKSLSSTIQRAKNSHKIHNTFSILLQYVAWTQWIIRSALTFEWMATYQSRYLRSSLAPLHLLAMHCKSRSMYQHHHYHQDEHHPLHPDHHHQNKNYLHNCFIHCFVIFNAIIRIITDIIAICIDIN